MEEASVSKNISANSTNIEGEEKFINFWNDS